MLSPSLRQLLSGMAKSRSPCTFSCVCTQLLENFSSLPVQTSLTGPPLFLHCYHSRCFPPASSLLTSFGASALQDCFSKKASLIFQSTDIYLSNPSSICFTFVDATDIEVLSFITLVGALVLWGVFIWLRLFSQVAQSSAHSRCSIKSIHPNA